MSQSKPDNLGKNAGGASSSWDFGIHFRAKDDTITEVPLNQTHQGKVGKKSTEADTEKHTDHAKDQDNDFHAKADKSFVETPASHSSSPSPSDYKKMLKNLNEFTEKITRSVEEKISEIKSDLGSGKTRTLNSKDNSSMSDSEENSDGSGTKMAVNDSPKKSLSLDLVADYYDKEIKNDNFECGSELRQRKWTRGAEIMTYSSAAENSNQAHKGTTFEEYVEVEPAVEAYEHTNPEDSDSDGPFIDAEDILPVDNNGDDDGDRQSSDGDIRKFVRFVANPENKKMDGCVLFFTMCILLLPLPPFFKGFLTCIVAMIIWRLLTNYWKAEFEASPLVPHVPFSVPDYDKLPPLKVPPTPQERGVWFNEYTQPYDPDWYSVSQTVPVYMEIENSLLKLSRPKGKINRRATYDEKKYKLDFVNQRVYDLKHCRVTLKPNELVRKRFFSKKYPIFIELGPKSLVKCVKFKESSLEEEPLPIEQFHKPNVQVGNKDTYGKEYLNLFARCKRQKEEWFRRLIAASKFQGIKSSDEDNGPSTPFEKINFHPELAEYDEYWQYMTQFVETIRYVKPIMKIDGRRKSFRKRRKDDPDIDNMSILDGKRRMTTLSNAYDAALDISERENAVKSAMEVQWFNALMNRFLFDLFRTPYWLNKIQYKLQKKLASVRLPYYIEALEIIEMDLGKMGPRFHRISPPVLDDRGLWIDMDMTFNSSVRLILQTQLNLLKLQRGLEEEVSKLPESKSESRHNFGAKKNKDVGTSTHAVDNGREMSMKELMLEFAEMAVVDKTQNEEVNVTNPNTNTNTDPTDVEDSDSTESDEDDEDEDDDEEDDDDDEDEVNPESEGFAKPPSYDSLGLQPEVPVSEPRRPSRRSSKKIFRVMESVAKSKYFKSIAETKYVQKAIAGVSAMKLRLLLEIKSCIGTITVNVPPPPNDRIWYGFRTVPKIWMSAQPKIGHRSIRFSHIKHFVEKKIMEEVKKLVVLPNMDDIIYPIPPDTDQLAKFTASSAANS